jgi:hypothetical protein
MSGSAEITYMVDFQVRRKAVGSNPGTRQPKKAAESVIPRIARLMALAIRVDGLIREQRIPDYATVARRGHVTRARMTQIMQLLDLAPDLQEQILFLPPGSHLQERHLRPIVRHIDWGEQRCQFQELTRSVGPSAESA